MVYLLVVGLTMLVLPLASIAVEFDISNAPMAWLIGKLFVFWSVGARLFLAGARQYVQPAFTSRDIMGIESPEVYGLVRELGGANIASGVLGLASIVMPNFVLPTAIGAGIFLAVAGVEHVRTAHRGRHETIAMISDFFVAAVLIGFALGTFFF
ncbi:DUF6790 family protein [Sphingomonas sp. CARO-RG-8B-R24-01]|uniref:DUF6790 family protein n=1 Tax=Sphingomonas sp. CARO-RG-8B-R24-01 TaxID=2914831 RepID=UPI001F56598D|nr:DUF6790 family protein [Sphingomonas sp. CARO-RG-8B-R24-01]